MWQRWGWLVRWGGTAAGIAYILHVVDFSEARAAFARIPVGAIGLAIVLVAANVVVGAARWRTLLVAYGADRRPTLARATVREALWTFVLFGELKPYKGVDVLIDASYTITDVLGKPKRPDKRDQNELILEWDGHRWLFISGM